MTTIVAIHVAVATAAVLLGAGILLMRRGTPRHRWAGRLWVSAMTATAATSFGIRELGHGNFSWLHALSAYVLVGLALAVLAIRRGDVAAHRRQMMGLFTGLVIAGVAAVAVPGRALGNAFAQMWQHDARPIGTLKQTHTETLDDGHSEGLHQAQNDPLARAHDETPEIALKRPKSGSGPLAMIAGAGWSGAGGAQQ
ncbi:hypothetical protein PAN31117_03873 [Pandoraea anapnoica]|uniref:DUF2306 domain-containing protein n=1 Tax=Pandoraea anapnoica TaxID=2508301 RepID=A0A5E5ABF0_9BURK|nr:DUF2306 domain-containing protein [Pandoraea anapnoica]VVE70949.1 hypothetical protein PAN31117_03873 [Pandoraea anapnoica]